MPFAGSIVAILFYRFVYLKTQLMLQKELERGTDDLTEVKQTI